MRVGDRIVHKQSLRGGYIHDARKLKNGVYIVEIGWDESGLYEWIPSDQVRPVDKVSDPPPTQTTSWGRTTPDYLVALRRDLRIKSSSQPNKWAEKNRLDKLADDLIKLSGQRKNRSRIKARKLIKKFEDGLHK